MYIYIYTYINLTYTWVRISNLHIMYDIYPHITYIYIYIDRYIPVRVYIYMCVCDVCNPYLLCSRYVPQCPVFLLIVSPMVALHQESIYKLHVEINYLSKP